MDLKDGRKEIVNFMRELGKIYETSYYTGLRVNGEVVCEVYLNMPKNELEFYINFPERLLDNKYINYCIRVPDDYKWKNNIRVKVDKNNYDLVKEMIQSVVKNKKTSY